MSIPVRQSPEPVNRPIPCDYYIRELHAPCGGQAIVGLQIGDDYCYFCEAHVMLLLKSELHAQVATWNERGQPLYDGRG